MGQTMCIRCKRSLGDGDHLFALTKTCENCLKVLLSSPDESRSQYLETLAHPAALVAPDHTVILANSRFRAMKLGQEVVGLRVGEVLDCLYAPLLGRCGETLACMLCGLRKAVEHTWRTGEGLRDVPMSYPHKAATRKTYVMDTEKAGGAILLILQVGG